MIKDIKLNSRTQRPNICYFLPLQTTIQNTKEELSEFPLAENIVYTYLLGINKKNGIRYDALLKQMNSLSTIFTKENTRMLHMISSPLMPNIHKTTRKILVILYCFAI